MRKRETDELLKFLQETHEGYDNKEHRLFLVGVITGINLCRKLDNANDIEEREKIYSILKRYIKLACVITSEREEKKQCEKELENK